MQLATMRFDISRSTILLDAHRFGFASRDDADLYLNNLLGRIETSFEASAIVLDAALAQFMRERLAGNLALLREP